MKTVKCPCGGTFHDIRAEIPGSLNGPWRCDKCNRTVMSLMPFLPVQERAKIEAKISISTAFSKYKNWQSDGDAETFLRWVKEEIE